MRVSQARGAPGIFRIHYPCVIADRRTIPCDFCFRFSRSVLKLFLVPQKAASAAGSEAGMDCGTALAKQALLVTRRCGGASSHVHARRRPPPRGESERLARKPLKSLDSRKKEAWNLLPLALNFLPNDLDFPSPGFANPSPHFVKSRLSRGIAPLPLAFIELRAAGEAPLLREGGARRFKMCECGRDKAEANGAKRWT